MISKVLAILAVVLVFLAGPSLCRKPHIINFRLPGLYPEAFTWDSKSDHFIVGSTRHGHLISVSDAGVTGSLTPENTIPPNSSFLSVAVDRYYHRILAVVHRPTPLVNALASYQLPTFGLLSLTHLISAAVASAVAVDFAGNAYIADSGNYTIFKITKEGEVSILSQSQAFKSRPVEPNSCDRNCGLNGIIYNPKGYLLVSQSNTGKLFKVDVNDGTTRRVILNKDLATAEGLAVRSDDVVLVVSRHKLYFIKSHDSWSEGVVFDESPLEEERRVSAVTVAAENRVYVLYGLVNEGMDENSERAEFRIAEVESEKEREDDNVWIFVLIGLGLVYFLIWRFQMKHLVQNMNKKTA